MSKYIHYKDFTLQKPITGKSETLSDLGGIVINTDTSVYERECMPEVSSVTDSSTMRDGEIYVNSKVGSRVIEFTVFFSMDRGWSGSTEEIKGWLFGNRGYQKLSFPDDFDNKEIWVAYNGEALSQMYYGSEKHLNCKMKLKFIAYDPYWNIKQREFVCSEENGTQLEIDKGVTTRTLGNCDCYPLITIIPNTSKVHFKWNELDVKITNLKKNEPYYIDCENEYTYILDDDGTKILSLKNFKTNDYWDFPIVRYGMKNLITLKEGSIKTFIVSHNSRKI